MSIIETNTNTGDVSMWDVRISRARKDGTPLPSLVDISSVGIRHEKIVRFTGEDGNRLMVEVQVCAFDDRGNILPGTEEVQEPEILVGRQISEAHIRVGSIVLDWQPTPEL